jgi:hypothetical protein
VTFAVGAGNHGDHVLAVAADQDQCDAGRSLDMADKFEVGSGRFTKRASASEAKASLPTAPHIFTAAPARCAASAWLAPLPPCAVVKSDAGDGFAWFRQRLAVVAIRSMLTDPMTVIMAASLACPHSP